MLVGESVWMKDIGCWLDEEYGKDYKITKK
jgi:hypothetical protein